MISKRVDLRASIDPLSGSQNQGSSTGALRLPLPPKKLLSKERNLCDNSFKKILMGVKVHCNGKSYGVTPFTGQSPTQMAAPRLKVCSDIVERPFTLAHFLGYSVSPS